MKLTGRALGTSLAGSALAAAALLAAGCSSSGAGTAGPAASAARPSVASPVASSGATAQAVSAPANAAPASSAPAAVATDSPAAPAASAPACDNLKVTLRNGGVYNANTYTLIDFTNESSAACTLHGTPSVSLFTASGRNIPTDIKATPNAAPAATVTLAPAGTANARLTVSGNAAKDYPAAQCKPETSAYIGVLPSGLAPASLAFSVSVCTTSYVDNLSVAPFTAGAGTYIDG
jgi:hypothetical protein